MFKLDLGLISSHKLNLGYEGNINNIALVEKASILGSLAYSATLFIDTLFILSFEKKGLLFMGVDKLYNLTGNDFLISFTDVKELTLNKAFFIKGRLFFNAEKLSLSTINGENYTFNLFTYVLGNPWIKENLSNIHELALNYPNYNEKHYDISGVSPVKPMKLHTYSDSSVKEEKNESLDVHDIAYKLIEYKKLYDDNLITKDDFLRLKGDLLSK